MPELPEVESTRRGIAPHLAGRTITAVVVRRRRLRLPIPRALDAALPGSRVRGVTRRAKYLLIGTAAGTALVHLGMSGSLRVLPAAHPPGKHDHWDLVLDDGRALRLNDPRRFGLLLWCTGDRTRTRCSPTSAPNRSSSTSARSPRTSRRGRAAARARSSSS